MSELQGMTISEIRSEIRFLEQVARGEGPRPAGLTNYRLWREVAALEAELGTR